MLFYDKEIKQTTPLHDFVLFVIFAIYHILMFTEIKKPNGEKIN